MNCVLYARVSTDKQAEKDLSIPAQLQEMRRYAEQHRWAIVDEFLEPGVSARTAERPVLKQMLARCKAMPRIDVVLVHKIDRLARNVFDHATIRALLKQRAVRLASVVENVDDTITGQLVENIMASIAEFYSANLGEEAKKGMRQVIERGGWPHRPPRGYRVVRDAEQRAVIEVVEHEAVAIRAAFERYSAGGVAIQHVADGLAAAGMTTGSGKRLPRDYVWKLLSNPFYIGRIRWKGREHPGKHPAIVSVELFGRVQSMLRARAQNPGEKGRLHFLLRGIARCGGCGHKMTAERHGQWSYYRCIRNALSEGCDAKFSNVERTHESLVRLYEELTLPTSLRTALRTAAQKHMTGLASDAGKAAAAFRKQQAKLDQREADAANAFASGDLPLRSYQILCRRLRDVRQVLAMRAPQHLHGDAFKNKVDAILQIAGSLASLHQRFSEERRQRLAALVFKDVVLEQGRIHRFTLRPPFDRVLTVDSDSRERPSSPSKGALTPALEVRHLTPAINSIFEFDDSQIADFT